ncbi:MAG: MMPL family transporter [Oscillospiraceae bacterium]
MRRVKKPVFFIVAVCIAVFTFVTLTGISSRYGDNKTTYIKGAEDIRWGIDIRGGVDVTFAPPEGYNASESEMNAAKSVIEQRLVTLNITDHELYVDYNNDRIIVRFPWKSDEADFNPENAVKELGETARLTFREGYETDETGTYSGVTADTIILEGKDVDKAEALYNSEDKEYFVSLELTSDGAVKFSEATERLLNKTISIWMDEVCISYPTVQAHITDGKAIISNGKSAVAGGFTVDEVTTLANKINSGALPFKLETASLNVISPTLGTGARDSMVLSGIIAFCLIAVYITIMYRLPGAVATIALVGQVVGSIAAISGFFGAFPSFTLTIPGIAGIILAVGIGVDANIITAERIKEELAKGKTLDGSIAIGYKRAFSAIFDGNITVIIVAMILMGAFGPPDSFFSKLLTPIFFMFGPSTAGAIYSFGYTLMVGVILNFIFGVTASRLMLTSISKFKTFRNKKFYGGAENE